MAIREAVSFCRTCTAHCGVRLTIEDDKIVTITGDKEHPLSRGYACFKGLHQAAAHHGEDRLLHPLKRQPDGSFAYIPLEVALDEIADKLRELIDREGPDSIGMLIGNGAIMNSPVYGYHQPFMEALGSRHFYTPTTIDQPAKLVSFERLGGWAAGQHRVADSDVFMVFGSNAVISHATLHFVMMDPVRTLKEAKARGLKLIVIDPRRTETARYADLFLQPIPGQDAVIIAAMIRIILTEGLEDKDFCDRWVGADRMQALRDTVEPFTEELAARRAGLKMGEIRAAVEMFIENGPRGSVTTGTGNNMAVFSNATQHLADCMNVVCGRMNREGDPALVDMLMPESPVYAEVIPPPRSWQHFPPGRIRGVGKLIGRESLTPVLPDEILTPGEGQIRALLIDGGNPAVSAPDQQRMLEALRALELSVVIDPHMTLTAKHAHYILPPLMPYERPDLPLLIPGFTITTQNWLQYTAPVIPPPEGAEVVEDWYVLWSLAKRLGIDVLYNGTTRLNMKNRPDVHDLLAIRAAKGRVPLDELKKYPSGKVFTFPSDRVSAARSEASAKFDVMPKDVAGELRQVLAYECDATNIVSQGKRFTHFLTCRRMRNMFNSVGTHVGFMRERDPYNPLHMHPDDIAGLGLANGERVEVESDAGKIETIVKADDSMRPGVVSITHAWGSAPDDPERGAACVSALIDARRDIEELNAMPRMSGIPVNIRPMAQAAAASKEPVSGVHAS